MGVNVLIVAALATCMSLCWCLYTSTGLVLDLEMRDPERGKKLAEGELVSRIISTLATRILDKKEETNKMVQMESRFKQSEESSEYQPDGGLGGKHAQLYGEVNPRDGSVWLVDYVDS